MARWGGVGDVAEGAPEEAGGLGGPAHAEQAGDLEPDEGQVARTLAEGGFGLRQGQLVPPELEELVDAVVGRGHVHRGHIGRHSVGVGRADPPMDRVSARANLIPMRRITLISTGGTIEKTYDEHSGSLENRASVVQEMLGLLRLEDTVVNTLQLMHKDSLHLTDADRERIVGAVELVAGPAERPSESEGVVILHGTDTLCVTGELLHERISAWVRVPVILTGAMRPFEMKRSDALQNLTEAIFATGVLGAGVWAVAHGRALPFPGLVKDRERGTFRRAGVEV